MPDVDGLEVLRAAKQLRPETEFILMTQAHGSVSTAVDAMRLGAYDYLTEEALRARGGARGSAACPESFGFSDAA